MIMQNKLRKIDKKGRMNKKGFMTWFFVLIVLMGFSIFMLVVNKIVPEINAPLAESLSNNLPDNSPVNVTDILNSSNQTMRNMSNMLPFLIIGLVGFVLISAGAIMKHPIMIFVGIIIFAVVILIGAIYSNVYSEIANSDGFSDVSDQLLIQKKFMDFLPTIIFIIAIGIIGFILYGKSSGGSGL